MCVVSRMYYCRTIVLQAEDFSITHFIVVTYCHFDTLSITFLEVNILNLQFLSSSVETQSQEDEVTASCLLDDAFPSYFSTENTHGTLLHSC